MKTLLKLVFFPLLWIVCAAKVGTGHRIHAWDSVVAVLSMASLVGIAFVVHVVQRGGF